MQTMRENPATGWNSRKQTAAPRRRKRRKSLWTLLFPPALLWLSSLPGYAQVGGAVDLVAQPIEISPEQARPGTEIEARVRFENSGVTPAENAQIRIQTGDAWKHVVWQARRIPALSEYELQEFYQRGLDAEFALNSPRALAATADGRHVYVVTRDAGAALVAFHTNVIDDENGRPTSLNLEPFQTLSGDVMPPGVTDLVLTKDEEYVYGAAPGVNSLVVLRRNPANGELTVLQRMNSGGVEKLPLLGVNNVALDPEGRFLFATSPLEGAITVFRRDPQSGLLNLASVFGASNGVTSLQDLQALAVGPLGRTVYAASGSEEHLFALFLDRESGRLNLIQSLDLEELTMETGKELKGISSIVLSRNGRFLFASGFASDSIAVFWRRGDRGELTLGEIFSVEDLEDDAGNLLDGPTRLVYSAREEKLFVVSQFANALLEFAPQPNGRLIWQGALRDGVAGISGMLSPRDLALARGGQAVFVPAAQSNALLAFLQSPQQLQKAGAGPVNTRVTMPEGTGVEYHLRAVNTAAEEKDRVVTARVQPGNGQSEIDARNNTSNLDFPLASGAGKPRLSLDVPPDAVAVAETFSLQLRLENASQQDPLQGRLKFRAPEALQGLTWVVQQHPPIGSILEKFSAKSNFADRLVVSPDGRFIYVLHEDRDDPLTLWSLPLLGEQWSDTLEVTPLSAPTELADLAFLASGERAAGLAANGREIYLFQRNPFTGLLQVQERLTEAETGLPQGAGFAGIALEPNSGSLIIIARQLPSITVMSWVSETGEPLQVPRIAANLDLSQLTDGQPAELTDLVFSDDGHWLAMAGRNLSGLLVFRRGENAESLALQYRIRDLPNVRALHFAPHNRRLYALSDGPEPGSAPQLHSWTLPAGTNGARLLRQTRALPEEFTAATTLFQTHNGQLLHVHDTVTQRHRVYRTQRLSPRLEDLGPGDLQDYDTRVLATVPLGGARTDSLCVLTTNNPDRTVAEELQVLRLATPARLEPESSALEQIVNIPVGGSLTYSLKAATRVETKAGELALTAEFQPFGDAGGEVTSDARLALQRPVVPEGLLTLISEFAQPAPGQKNALQLTLQNSSPLPLLKHRLQVELPEQFQEVSWSAETDPASGTWNVVAEQELPRPAAVSRATAAPGAPLLLSHDGRHLYIAAVDGSVVIAGREAGVENLLPPMAMDWPQDAVEEGNTSALAQDATGQRLVQWLPRAAVLRVLARNQTEGSLDLAQSFALAEQVRLREKIDATTVPEDFLGQLEKSYLAYSEKREEFLLILPADQHAGQAPRVLASLREPPESAPWLALQLVLGDASREYSDDILAGILPEKPAVPITAQGGETRFALDGEGLKLQVLKQFTHEFQAEGQGAPDFPVKLSGQSSLILTLTGSFPSEMQGPVTARAFLADPKTETGSDRKQIAHWEASLVPQADLRVSLEPPEKVVLDQEFRVKTTVRNAGPSVARDIAVLQRGRRGILFLGQEGLERRGFPVQIPQLNPDEEFSFTTVYSTPLGEGFSTDTSIQQYVVTDTSDPVTDNNASTLQREVLVPLLHQPRPDTAAVVVGQRVLKHLLVTFFEETYTGLTLHCTLSPGLRFEEAYITGNPAESAGLLRRKFSGELPQPRIEASEPLPGQPQEVRLHFEGLTSPAKDSFYQRQFVVHLAAIVEDDPEIQAGNELLWTSRLEWEELQDLPEVYRTHALAQQTVVLREPAISATAEVLEPAADAADLARYRITLENADTELSADAHDLELEFAVNAPHRWMEASSGPAEFQELRIGEKGRLELPTLRSGETAVFDLSLVLKDGVHAGADVIGQGDLSFRSLPGSQNSRGRAYETSFAAEPFSVAGPAGVLTYYGPTSLSVGQDVVWDLVLDLPEAETRDLQIELDMPEHLSFENARVSAESLLLDQPTGLQGRVPQLEIARGEQHLTLHLGHLSLAGNNLAADNGLVVEIVTRLRDALSRGIEELPAPGAQLGFRANDEIQIVPVRLDDPQMHLGQTRLRILALGSHSHDREMPDVTHYQILIANTAGKGGAIAQPAVFEVVIPSHLEFLAATASDGSLTTTREGSRLSLGLDRLLPGQSSVITLQMMPISAGAVPAQNDLGTTQE